ncbi:hypothetical protein PMIN06_001960 [Paraphaeosphaeria minitans]
MIPAEPLNSLQYLDTQEGPQQFASRIPETNELNPQEMIRKVLEETLASRNVRIDEQLGVLPDTTTRPQKFILPETSSKSGIQDGTERLSKLEKFILAEREDIIRKSAFVEAEHEAQKKKSDEDK